MDHLLHIMKLLLVLVSCIKDANISFLCCNIVAA